MDLPVCGHLRVGLSDTSDLNDWAMCSSNNHHYGKKTNWASVGLLALAAVVLAFIGVSHHVQLLFSATSFTPKLGHRTPYIQPFAAIRQANDALVTIGAPIHPQLSGDASLVRAPHSTFLAPVPTSLLSHFGLIMAALTTVAIVFLRGSSRRRNLILTKAPRQEMWAMFATSSEKESTTATKAAEPTAEEITAGHIRKVVIVVGLALLFAIGVFVTKGVDAGSEFLAAYLIEYSLSIDNLFVFLVIFKYFKCEDQNQEKVLNYGLFSAAILRFIFLFVGEELLQNFAPGILIFGAILLYSSYNILAGKDDEEEEDEDMSQNQVVKFAQSFLTVSDDYDGNRFFTNINGRRLATPLLLVLVVVELSDILFAVDSVPAVLGTTQDLFVAYTSNLFAILGLRSLYFLLADSLDKFKYIEPAIGGVLGFIGAKIIVEFAGVDVSTPLSLGVVATLLGSGVFLSLNDPWADKDENK